MAHHTTEIPEDVEIPSSAIWSKLLYIGLGLAAVGLAATFATVGSHKDLVVFNALYAFIFWLSIGLGCMGFVIIQHLVRAGWSTTVRRIAENGAMSIPLLGVVFAVTVLMGSHELWPWMHETDPILERKRWWLTTNMFYVRAVIYFVIWSGIAWFFWSRSTKQDTASTDAEREALTRQMWKGAGPALILFGVSLTLASVDWIMSLQPHWYSTIFGVYFFAGSILGAFAFMTLIVKGLQGTGLMRDAVSVEHFHDLGKFLFGHTIFWAYIGFSQFFLIWYANIPEETEFYIHRTHHGWEYLSWGMPLFHFFVPFFFLLSRWVKRHHLGIIVGATYLFLVHAVDIYWLVMPMAGAHGGHAMHAGGTIWMTIAAFVGVGGLFIAVFGFFLNRNRIVATNDPRIHEALAHQNY